MDRFIHLKPRYCQYLFNEKFSDATLLIDGERIPVHRVILTEGSKYFNRLFLGPLSLKGTVITLRAEDLLPIEEKERVLETLKLALSYLYGCEITLKVEEAVLLYRVADYLLIDELKRRIKQTMKFVFVPESDRQLAKELGISELFQ